MFHFLIAHYFMQVITLPSSIDDLKTWLLIPAVMGVIATFFVNLYLSVAPDKYKNLAMGVRFIVYIAIALLSVVLAKIPPDVLDAYQPIFIAIMAAIAAFIGDAALNAAGRVAMLTAATVLGIGMRIAFGKDAAHTSFKDIIVHG